MRIPAIVCAVSSLLLAACGTQSGEEASTASAGGAEACTMLASASLTDMTIVSAQMVTGGSFTPPAPGAKPIENLPVFCRVVATMRPVPDDVTMEVWLPAEGWAGDFQPAGNGFWGGNIPYARMAVLLRAGLVTAGSNLGITGAQGPSFASSTRRSWPIWQTRPCTRRSAAPRPSSTRSTSARRH